MVKLVNNYTEEKNNYTYVYFLIYSSVIQPDAETIWSFLKIILYQKLVYLFNAFFKK